MMAKKIKNPYILEILLLISKQPIEKTVIYILASDIPLTLTPKFI